jgi:hypothetical protein
MKISDMITRLRITQEQAKELHSMMRNWEWSEYAAEGETTQYTIMERANEIMNGFGVENLTDENAYDPYWQNTIALYVNMGDTYNSTLLFDVGEGEFILTTWGDWFEEYERRKNEE